MMRSVCGLLNSAERAVEPHISFLAQLRFPASFQSGHSTDDFIFAGSLNKFEERVQCYPALSNGIIIKTNLVQLLRLMERLERMLQFCTGFNRGGWEFQ